MRSRYEKKKPKRNDRRMDDIRTEMTSVEHPSDPRQGCACGPLATGRRFTRKLQRRLSVAIPHSEEVPLQFRICAADDHPDQHQIQHQSQCFGHGFRPD
jgi:hypothetical protein